MENFGKTIKTANFLFTAVVVNVHYKVNEWEPMHGALNTKGMRVFFASLLPRPEVKA